MPLPLVDIYPYPGVRITPARGHRSTVEEEAAGTVFPIAKSRDFLVTDNCVDEFHQFLKRHPEAVRTWKEVWCLDNHVPWTDPEREPELTGYAVEMDDEMIMGGLDRVFLYADRDSAVADLARGHERVGLVWGVWRDGPPAARGVARAFLDGDPEALPVLADALEEAGDPRGAVVRGWLPPKPARKRPGKSGPRKGKGK
jgi:hypothetical protein